MKLATDRRKLWAAVAAVTFLLPLSSSATAELIYRQSFDSGLAPDVTPGGGVFGLSGNPVPAINPTGGVGPISNGAISSASVDGVNANTVAATTASTYGLAPTPGSGINLSSISGNGSNFKGFTITFWANVSQFYGSDATTTQQRLLILGDSSATDVSGANTLGFTLRRINSGFTNDGLIDVFGGGNWSSSTSPGSGASGTVGGVPNTLMEEGQWYFIAFTYDGTATVANDSTVQQAKLGAGDPQLNGQLYFGNDVYDEDPNSLVRNGLPVTSGSNHGTPNATARGDFNFGSEARMMLFNRFNSSGSDRFMDGFIDDIRIYDEVLTPAQVNAVRLEALVPEPNSLVLACMALGFLARRRPSRTAGK